MATNIIILCFLLPFAYASSNGIDTSMDGSMSLMTGSMLPYFHFTPGDNLWFMGWVPASSGAMVGTCIGLFLLAVVERWMEACRAVMESYEEKQVNSKIRQPSLFQVLTFRAKAPPSSTYDFIRGAVQVGQSALAFLFMLTVMTFQVSFIFSLVIGAGVGETLFGRYTWSLGRRYRLH